MRNRYSSLVKPAVGFLATEGGAISPADVTVHVLMVLYQCSGDLSLTLVITDKLSSSVRAEAASSYNLWGFEDHR